jgi:GNAT superfamily N-acetyltransferase
MSGEYSFRPVTRAEWKDLEELFGPRGACAGCWCMWWRLSRGDFNSSKGEDNRRALKRIVDSGEVPGILAYRDGRAVGWCSVAPRERFTALERSRVLKRIDGRPVWSIVCFFVAKKERKQGLTRALILAAADYARASGALVVEGYPVEPRSGRYPDAFAYTGFASAFLAAGFTVAARPSDRRSIYRLALSKG